MLTLKNISKYYAQNGVVTQGLRKINVSFNIGEFVAIVGESGSGKSTLLNVLSGLDSYEEGDMLINQQNTSHYTQVDWEAYRRDYIGFVFQNYNIIASFTVYQNIEAALIISQYDPTKRKQRVLELIEQVGLTPYKDTKASKLSGGQMQRTVIARALAKDCPVLIADEPTGNLDSATSKQIIQLLADISRDKLVIMVTHNIEEVEDVITRKITLYDGAIIDDQAIKQTEPSSNNKVYTQQQLTLGQRLINNLKMAGQFLTATPMKSLLIFSVLLLLSLASSFIYSNMLNIKASFDKNASNPYFLNSTDQRIVIHKHDLSPISVEEEKQLTELDNVEQWIARDLALDTTVALSIPKHNSEKRTELHAGVSLWSLIKEDQLIAGKLPENEHEVLLNTKLLRKGTEIEDLLNKQISLNYKNTSYPVTVTGISDSTKIGEMIYLSPKLVDTLSAYSLLDYYSTTTSLVNLSNKAAESIGIMTQLEVNNKVQNDQSVHVNEAFVNEYCAAINMELEACKQQLIGTTIHVQSLTKYNTEPMLYEYVISGVSGESSKLESATLYYSETALRSLLYEELIYQGSLISYSSANIARLTAELESLGYTAFYPYETINTKIPLIRTLEFITIALYLLFFLGIFFLISYFILNTMLASKKKDYIILRSIGASSSTIVATLLLELILCCTGAYAINIIISKLSIMLPRHSITSFLKNTFKYYALTDYFAMYLILLSLILLLVYKMRKKLLSGSIMTTLQGE